MKKLFCIIIISIFLVGACITEEILVRRTLTEVNKKGNELFEIVGNLNDLNTEHLLQKTRELNDFWIENEDKLCFFVNHKDMIEMGNEIIKMVSYAKNNIKEEYTTSLELVLYFSSQYNHIMGVSLENIF